MSSREAQWADPRTPGGKASVSFTRELIDTADLEVNSALGEAEFLVRDLSQPHVDPIECINEIVEVVQDTHR